MCGEGAYSEENKYLIPCWFYKLAPPQRNEWCIYFNKEIEYQQKIQR